MKKEYINYRIIADKELLEFLRSDEEDRFSKMDALCDLLDKASGENLSLIHISEPTRH